MSPLQLGDGIFPSGQDVELLHFAGDEESVEDDVGRLSCSIVYFSLVSWTLNDSLNAP